jgi:hypothetical protein
MRHITIKIPLNNQQVGLLMSPHEPFNVLPGSNIHFTTNLSEEGDQESELKNVLYVVFGGNPKQLLMQMVTCTLMNGK